MRPLPPPPPPPPIKSVAAGLVGQVFEVVEAIEADPAAMKAVHELQFAAVSIRRSGAELAAALRQAVAHGWQHDETVRPWLVNAIEYGREILRR